MYTVVVRIKIGAESQQDALKLADRCFTRGELPKQVDSMQMQVESFDPGQLDLGDEWAEHHHV
jgi:hypothetical protein